MFLRNRQNSVKIRGNLRRGVYRPRRAGATTGGVGFESADGAKAPSALEIYNPKVVNPSLQTLSPAYIKHSSDAVILPERFWNDFSLNLPLPRSPPGDGYNLTCFVTSRIIPRLPSGVVGRR